MKEDQTCHSQALGQMGQTEFRGPLVRVLRVIGGSGPVERRMRRLHLAFAAALSVSFALWTWVFVHFDLDFGVGIDFVLVLLTFDQLTRARKGRSEQDRD